MNKFGGDSMKKSYIVFISLLAFYFIVSIQAFASRAVAPLKIPSILYNGIKIVAENSSPENMGLVEAFNVNTNSLIWSRKIYEVKINPTIEEDTQFKINISK
jgi:hypothetical protein